MMIIPNFIKIYKLALNYWEETDTLTGTMPSENTFLYQKKARKKLRLYFINVLMSINSRGMRLAGHVACMGNRTGAHRVLVGRPEEMRPVQRPSRMGG
jgi:hypothetical protein